MYPKLGGARLRPTRPPPRPPRPPAAPRPSHTILAGTPESFEMCLGDVRWRPTRPPPRPPRPSHTILAGTPESFEICLGSGSRGGYVPDTFAVEYLLGIPTS